MPDADYARVAEVARRLGVSPQTVRRHIAGGNLAGLNIGTRTRQFWRINATDLAAFEQARTHRAPGATCD